jgi:hypothetical protein
MPLEATSRFYLQFHDISNIIVVDVRTYEVEESVGVLLALPA